MGVLTAVGIRNNNLVQNAATNGERPTTYDATVGVILQGGCESHDAVYRLPPRGVVWVISAETFELPDTITGLATLRTTWTHQGILALNVGVVDPGYHGPLATALVNFSSSDFELKVGDPFFRVLFHEHAATGEPDKVQKYDDYRRTVAGYSRAYGRTFLNMDALVSEVSDKVLGLPRWAYRLTIGALILSFLAIFCPIALSVWSDYRRDSVKIEQLEADVEDLKKDETEDERLRALEDQVRRLRVVPKGT